jgi:hypothetical protein
MALSLTRYLESLRGFDGLVDALAFLGEGHDLDAALTDVFGDGRAALCRSWALEVLEGSGP